MWTSDSFADILIWTALLLHLLQLLGYLNTVSLVSAIVISVTILYFSSCSFRSISSIHLWAPKCHGIRFTWLQSLGQFIAYLVPRKEDYIYKWKTFVSFVSHGFRRPHHQLGQNCSPSSFQRTAMIAGSKSCALKQWQVAVVARVPSPFPF